MDSKLKGVKKSTMTNEQRKLLCEYKRDHQGCTQQDLMQWVDKTFDLKVSQATISNTLKRSSEFLSANFDKKGSSKRHKAAKYPEMEKVVYEWFLQHQERVNMTGELIQPCDAGIIRAFKMYYRKRFYRKILEGYELNISSPEKINVLDAINLAVSAWRNVKQESIANCFRHCKLRSANPTGSNGLNDVNSGEDIRELENLIEGMHYRQKMNVKELLDYPGENNECYGVQSVEEIVADTVQNPVDDEVDDDSVALEPVTRKEALQAATTIHNFLLQYENTVPQLLSAIGRLKDEFNIDMNLRKKQVTIDSFFTRQS